MDLDWGEADASFMLAAIRGWVVEIDGREGTVTDLSRTGIEVAGVFTSWENIDRLYVF
jgi:hypothetical protein